MKPNGVNAGLWALCGYDPALEHFAALRRELMRRPDHESKASQLDRVLVIYLVDMVNELRDIAEPFEAYVRRRFDMLGHDLYIETVFRVIAISERDTELALALVAYAAALALGSAHGMAPWARFRAAVDDLYFEVYPQRRLAA